MPKLYKRVGRMLDRREITRPDTATVHEIDGDRVDIRIGNSPNVLRYVPVVGDLNSLRIGDQVNIDWELKDGASGYTPVVMVQTSGSGSGTRTVSEMFPDNRTIEYSSDGLRVKIGSITQAHLDFVPALQGHVHEDSLNAHGWQIDDSGTIFSNYTYIHSDGEISLGLAPNVVKLNSQHGTHRLWAGDVDPAVAPFSVTKEGAVHATAGDIGGWNIGATELSSDSGNAKINSTGPYISLGAAGYLSGTGFWVGKDSGIYKFFIGSSTGQYIVWDGDSLDINATINATGGYIGGWLIGEEDISADNGSVSLNSTYPSIAMGATSYLTGTGIWLGKHGSPVPVYKMFIGSDTGQYIAWDGVDLTINASFNAVSGTVGGWNITATRLYAGTMTNYVALASNDPQGPFSIWAGDEDPESAPFLVQTDGTLYSIIGHIGGWTIEYNKLSSNGVVLNSSLTPAIMLGATQYGDPGIWMGSYNEFWVFFVGNADQNINFDGASLAITGTVRSSDYVSGLTGWSIDADGDAEFNNVNVRGTIRSTVFEYGAIQSAAGTLGIFHSAAVVYETFSLPGTLGVPFTFKVKNLYPSASPIESGDNIRIQARSGDSVVYLWGQVSGILVDVDFTTLTISDTWDGIEYTTFAEGTAVIDYGKFGDTTGFITLSADGTVGGAVNMTMAIMDYSTWPIEPIIQSRIGNLNGSYGYTEDTYGVAFGKYADNNSFITIDPKDGIRMMYKTGVGVDVQNAKWALDGSILIGEVAANESNILIDFGSISLRTNLQSNLYMDSSGSLRVGAVISGQNYITIDGLAGIRIMHSTMLSEEPLAVWDMTGAVTIGYDTGSNPNVYISSGGVYLRQGKTNFIQMTTAGIIIGEVANNRNIITIDPTYGLVMKYRNASGADVTVIQMQPDGDLLIGSNVTSPTTTAIALFVTPQTYNGEAMTAGDLLIGDNSASNANILWDASASSLLFRAGTVKHIDLQADGDVFIGTNTAAASTTMVAIFTAAQTYNSEAVTAGDFLLGDNTAGASNLFWDSSEAALQLRTGTVNRIQMTDAGVLTINDSGGAAVFTFNASAGAEFTKPLTLGTSGGIYQGTGSFAAPTTGLKIFNSGGVGKISGYSSSVEQWTADTDGVLKAGAGAVILNSEGLILKGGYGGSSSIWFRNGGNEDFCDMYGNNDPFFGITGHVMHIEAWDRTTAAGVEAAEIRIEAHRVDTYNSQTHVIDFTVGITNDTTPHSWAQLAARTGVASRVACLGLNITPNAGFVLDVDMGDVRIKDGSLVMVEAALPSTPAAGFGTIYMNSTYSVPHCVSDGGLNLPMGLFQFPLDPLAGYLGASTTIGNNGGMYYFTIHSDAANDTIDWNFFMPRGWPGKTLTVFLYWAPGSATAGNVVWACEGRRVSNSVTVPTTPTSSGTVTSASSAVAHRTVVCSMTMSLASYAAGDAMAFRIYRSGSNASDTLAADAELYAVYLSVVG